MKIRRGYVTNSSSTSYIIRNISDSTKTMLDLLREATDGDWYLVGDGLTYGMDYTKGYDENEVEPEPFISEQEFLEAVAGCETFPPGVDVKIEIAWGDGGPIFMPDSGLSSCTKSFSIEYCD